jgi:MutS domain V
MPIRALWVLLGLATVVGVVWALRQYTRRKLLGRVRAEWGRFQERDRDMDKVSSYARAVEAVGASPGLDDRTWADLNMDEVFSILDRCESLVGQQVLYARLRSVAADNHLDAFERLVSRLTTDVATREQVQCALAAARESSAADLDWLTEPTTLQSEPWHLFYPVMGVTMLALLAVLPFWPGAFAFLVVGMITIVIVQAQVAPQMRVVAHAFRQVGPVLAAAAALRVLHAADVAAITEPLTTDRAALTRLRSIARWAGRDATIAAAGDLSSILLEYLNFVFCLDANAVFFGARELRAHGSRLRRVVAAVGDIDAAVSIASYRTGTEGWVRPEFEAAGTPAAISNLRHPLLPDAVPNSIAMCPPHGVIITGSNMSGKSTFLRTLGTSVVLAQTIHTCLADAYRAPRFVVRSCIGRTDDPASGKSYYLVEVESVLSLVHLARTSSAHLVLFDELFRGTNTIERIAAGEAVLRDMLAPPPDGGLSPHFVVAATHDQELVHLLDGVYAPFHFRDTVDDEGLAFDYQLRSGPSTSTNAIALLRLRGAPPDLVARAVARARELDHARGLVTR